MQSIKKFIPYIKNELFNVFIKNIEALTFNCLIRYLHILDVYNERMIVSIFTGKFTGYRASVHTDTVRWRELSG